MKLRVDYVTNSSSSSFVIVNKVNDCGELRAYMEEEYGMYGIRLLDHYLVNGVDIRHTYDKKKANDPDEYEENYIYYELPEDHCPNEVYVDEEVTFEPNFKYLFSTHYSYTTDVDEPGDDAWLEEHLPKEYIEEIYRTEDY